MPGIADREFNAGDGPVIGLPVAVPDRIGIADALFGKAFHQFLRTAVCAPVVLRGKEDKLLILQGLEAVYIPLPADEHARREEVRVFRRDGHQRLAAHALPRAVDPAAVHRVFAAQEVDKVSRKLDIARRRIAVDMVENRFAVQRHHDNRRELLLPFLRGPDQTADSLHQRAVRVGSDGGHIRQKEHQRIGGRLVVLLRQEDVVMDIEAGLTVGIGHPVKQGRLIQDQLPLVVGKAVVHRRERGLFCSALRAACGSGLFAGRLGRRVLSRRRLSAHTAQSRQKQHQREEKRSRPHAHTSPNAGAPVFCLFCPSAGGGWAIVLSYHAHTSQITRAPVNAAMKVKGMPIRVKSPVETL